MNEGPTPEYLRRCRARMDKIDAMPQDIRSLIHEFGLGPVQTCLDCGVRSAKHIRHLIVHLQAQSLYGNGGGVAKGRSAEVGRMIRNSPDAIRREAIGAFLEEAGCNATWTDAGG